MPVVPVQPHAIHNCGKLGVNVLHGTRWRCAGGGRKVGAALGFHRKYVPWSGVPTWLPKPLPPGTWVCLWVDVGVRACDVSGGGRLQMLLQPSETVVLQVLEREKRPDHLDQRVKETEPVESVQHTRRGEI